MGLANILKIQSFVNKPNLILFPYIIDQLSCCIIWEDQWWVWSRAVTECRGWHVIFFWLVIRFVPHPHLYGLVILLREQPSDDLLVQFALQLDPKMPIWVWERERERVWQHARQSTLWQARMIFDCLARMHHHWEWVKTRDPGTNCTCYTVPPSLLHSMKCVTLEAFIICFMGWD